MINKDLEPRKYFSTVIIKPSSEAAVIFRTALKFGGSAENLMQNHNEPGIVPVTTDLNLNFVDTSGETAVIYKVLPGQTVFKIEAPMLAANEGRKFWREYDYNLEQSRNQKIKTHQKSKR